MAKKWRKKIKKIGRKIQKYGSRALSVVAPVVGAIVAGPAGAAAGTALGAAGARYGGAAGARLKGKKGRAARKRGRSEMKRALATGGAVTGLSGILAIGGGTLGSSIGAISNIFGGGGGGPGTAGAAGDIGETVYSLTDQQFASTPAGSPSTPGLVSTLGDIGGKVFGGIFGDPTQSDPGTTGAPTGDRDPGEQTIADLLGSLFGTGTEADEAWIAGIPNIAVVGVGTLAVLLIAGVI